MAKGKNKEFMATCKEHLRYRYELAAEENLVEKEKQIADDQAAVAEWLKKNKARKLDAKGNPLEA
jgi:hypothetical protein